MNEAFRAHLDHALAEIATKPDDYLFIDTTYKGRPLQVSAERLRAWLLTLQPCEAVSTSGVECEDDRGAEHPPPHHGHKGMSFFSWFYGGQS